MLRLIITAVIAYLIFYLVRFLFRTFRYDVPFGGAAVNKSPGGYGEELVRDPVCGTYIPIGDALKLKVKRETLYFCSKECREAYSRRKE